MIEKRFANILIGRIGTWRSVRKYCRTEKEGTELHIHINYVPLPGTFWGAIQMSAQAWINTRTI